MNPSIALAAYAEPFLDGRRAVLFGDASTDLPEQLIERGARVVHVFDEDAARAGVAAARNRSRNISFAPLSDADVAVRDGAFDVAFVPNLAQFSDRPRLVKRVLRSLSTRGVAVFASENPDVKLASRASSSAEVSYYDLYDLVSADFDEVHMLGQTPFSGFAVVDFAHDGEPDISFDSGFVPGGAEEPRWYVAVASHREVDLEPFMVVQVPSSAIGVAESERTDQAAPAPAGEVVELGRRTPRATDAVESVEPGPAEPTADAAELAEAIAERDAARADLEAAVAERDAARAERDTAVSERNEARAERKAAVQASDGALSERDAAVQASARAQTERDEAIQARDRALAERDDARREISAARAEIEQLRAGAEPGARQLANATQSLQARASEALELTARLTQMETERDELAARVTELEARIEKAAEEPEQDELAADYANLESVLAERAETITAMRGQLAATEATGRELVARLAELTSARTDGADTASLQADLQAAHWTIDELEGILAERVSDDEATLARELAEARAELRRRETLLSQLKRAQNPDPPH